MNPKCFLVAAATILLLSTTTAQADPDVCGNINYDVDGIIDITDYTYAIAWLWGSGPAPPNFDVADWDQFELLTLFDLYLLVRSDFPPNCPPLGSPLHMTAAPHPGLYLHTYQSFVPPHSLLSGSTFDIDLYVTTDTLIQFSEHTVAVRIGGAIPTIQAFDYESECTQNPFSCSQVWKIDTARGALNLAWHATSSSGVLLFPGRTLVGTISIEVPPLQTDWEPITIALDSIGPVQDGYFVHQNWSMPYAGFPIWQNSTAHFPCIGLRGNVNGDPLDEVDVSDLTYLVNYMFNPPPQFPLIGDDYVDSPLTFEEVDMDASLSIDIADLTRLVGYMFKGGAAPEMCPN